MGSERARKRKRLFLCLACSVTMSLAAHGCVHFQKKSEAEQHLAKARLLMSSGKFQASLRENQGVLRRYPKTHGDRALIQMGLIYLHPQNPNADFQRSLKYFQRLTNKFPGSSLTGEAEIWIFWLQKLSEKEKEIETLNRICNRKEKELTEKKKDINESKAQVERLQNQIKTLQSQKNKLDLQIKDLSEQIKKLKEIDLGIEEKKRDTLRK